MWTLTLPHDQGGHRCCTQEARAFVSVMMATPGGMLLLVWLVSAFGYYALAAGDDTEASSLSKVRFRLCATASASRLTKAGLDWQHAPPDLAAPGIKDVKYSAGGTRCQCFQCQGAARQPVRNLSLSRGDATPGISASSGTPARFYIIDHVLSVYDCLCRTHPCSHRTWQCSC